VIDSGRFIHELDRHMFYCVIGQKVADKLAAQGVYDPVGTCIFFKKKRLTIIGKIREAPMGGMRPYEINDGIMVPLSTLQRLDKKAAIQRIIARARAHADRALIESEVTSYLSRHQINAMTVRTSEELVAQMQKQMKLFTLLLGTIGSISLVVGGIGVMNVMLVSVTERTKEIGIRRALGAREGDILFQFLVESVLLCIVGGFMGIAIGVGASWIIACYAKWQFTVFYNSIGLGGAVAVAAGIFFGIYPARQAARLSPIIALRSD
ncbi:ABC transporter permease, partial [Desulfobacter sp.]|uniref:ABC transporter permease n=1 Tax=Desulfobacter sp. TaxID=2294 RepID=UPI003D0B5916